MDHRDDIFYIREVLRGNTAIYSHLIDRHKDKVFNLAFRICSNREEAEEIAQDAFLKAYRSLKDFKGKSSFSTWLYRIAYNTAISLVRSKRKGIVSIDDLPAGIADFADYSGSGKDEETDYRNYVVNFALQRISEEERGLITLYYFNDLDHEEISKITGISRTNIKVKMLRARRKIAEIIKKVEQENVIYNEKSGSF